MRALVPSLTFSTMVATAVMLGGCTITVHRLGPMGEPMAADSVAGNGGLDQGSLLQITAAQQEQAWQGVQSHDIEAFADPLLSSPALLVPHPIELDPRMQDLQLLDPQMDPRLGLPGPGMPGL